MFLSGRLCEIYDSLLQLACNNTCPMQGVQTHLAHIITSKAPVKTINKNVASSNNKPKNKTHWNLAHGRAQNSFGFFQMSNNTCTCCILFHDLPIPPPPVRIFFVFLLSAILSKFCCKPSGRKHVSLHGLQLEKLEWILPKKGQQRRGGQLNCHLNDKFQHSFAVAPPLQLASTKTRHYQHNPRYQCFQGTNFWRTSKYKGLYDNHHQWWHQSVCHA